MKPSPTKPHAIHGEVNFIIILFFRWASRHQEADRHGLNLTERQILEWEGGDHGALSASPVSEPTTDRPEM
jgi:hypothetical protein